jgi:SAM-dependent methyltransferase
MSDTERWETRYRTGDVPWDTGRPSSELQRVIAEDRIAPCPALELGCGTGTNAVWLAERGIDVTAVDISSLAIERARQRAAAAGANVRLLTADVLTGPDVGGPFSFFFDRGCYHIVRELDLAAYLRLLERALRLGATGLVLTGNARLPRTGPPVVSEEEIRRELGALFEVVRLREFQFDEAGDSERHLGWSCLLRRRPLSEPGASATGVYSLPGR